MSSTELVTIPLGMSPRRVAITPDGRHVYVTADDVNPEGSSSGAVSVIDTGTNTVIARITVNPFPSGVAITPDGRHVYVLNPDGDPALIDTVTHERTFPIGGLSGGRMASLRMDTMPT